MQGYPVDKNSGKKSEFLVNTKLRGKKFRE